MDTKNSSGSTEENKMEYKIGTKFQTRGKFPVTCTVVDILKTYNSKNELVKVRYMATHELMGQTLTDHDVVGVTIARGLINQQVVA